MSDRENVVRDHVRDDAPDAPAAKRRKPSQPVGKAEAKARRHAERQAAQARTNEILTWLALDDDPLAQRLGRRLAEIESEIGFLDGYCGDRGRTDQRGNLRPAYSKLNDLRLADVRECKPLLDRYVEIAAERRATEGEPVVETYRCPACSATWTVTGRAQKFVAVYDDGEIVGSDPSGLTGVYDNATDADAALAAQEPAGCDDASGEGDSTSADLSRPGALPHRPLSAIAEGIADTPTARKLERMRARYARRATNPTNPDVKGYRGEA